MQMDRSCHLVECSWLRSVGKRGLILRPTGIVDVLAYCGLTGAWSTLVDDILRHTVLKHWLTDMVIGVASPRYGTGNILYK